MVEATISCKPKVQSWELPARFPFSGTSPPEATYSNRYDPRVSPCPVKTTPFYLQSPTTFELLMLKPRSLVSDSHCPLKLGCWNTRGWPLDSQFRSRVIHSLDLDLIGICETFLRENNEIHLEGYTWLGMQ